jgi:hypothetical protein
VHNTRTSLAYLGPTAARVSAGAGWSSIPQRADSYDEHEDGSLTVQAQGLYNELGTGSAQRCGGPTECGLLSRRGSSEDHRNFYSNVFYRFFSRFEN